MILFLLLQFNLLIHSGEVSFDSKIEVSNRNEATVADIARYKKLNDFEVSELGKMKLSQFDLDVLKKLIRDQSKSMQKNSHQNIKFVFPNQMSVTKVNGYSSLEFQRKLANELNQKCSECEFKIQSIKDQNVRIGSNWSIESSTVKLAPSMLATLTDELGNKAWVPVQIQIFKEVLVSKNNLQARQIVDQESFEMKKIDVSLYPESITAIDFAKKWETQTYIQAGRPILPNQIKTPLLVKRGGNIEVVIREGNFEISSTGVAEQDGRSGDIIPIKIQSNAKKLQGMIQSDGKVLVQ